MRRYESNRELKEALDKALGYVMPEKAFNKLIAHHHPPYDGADFDELQAAFRRSESKKDGSGSDDWVGELSQLSAGLFPEVVKRRVLYRLAAEGHLFRDLLRARYGAQWPGEALPDYLWWALRLLAFSTDELGRHPGRRLLTEKELALVRLAYVDERKPPSRCWPLWNHRYPKWAYANRRAFALALDRALELLIAPFYQIWFQERALAAAREGPAALEALFGEVALQFRFYRSALADLGEGHGSSKACPGARHGSPKAEVLLFPCPYCLLRWYLPALRGEHRAYGPGSGHRISLPG